MTSIQVLGNVVSASLTRYEIVARDGAAHLLQAGQIVKAGNVLGVVYDIWYDGDDLALGLARSGALARQEVLQDHSVNRIAIMARVAVVGYIERTGAVTWGTPPTPPPLLCELHTIDDSTLKRVSNYSGHPYCKILVDRLPGEVEADIFVRHLVWISQLPPEGMQWRDSCNTWIFGLIRGIGDHLAHKRDRLTRFMQALEHLPLTRDLVSGAQDDDGQRPQRPRRNK